MVMFVLWFGTRWRPRSRMLLLRMIPDRAMESFCYQYAQMFLHSVGRARL